MTAGVRTTGSGKLELLLCAWDGSTSLCFSRTYPTLQSQSPCLSTSASHSCKWSSYQSYCCWLLHFPSTWFLCTQLVLLRWGIYMLHQFWYNSSNVKLSIYDSTNTISFTGTRCTDCIQFPARAIAETMVMITGGIDFDTIFNDGDLLYSSMAYILFTIFLIAVAVLFINLLVSFHLDDM